MDERVARLEALVADLRERVADLETRVAPGDHAATFVRHHETSHDPLTAVAEIGAGSGQQWLALVGRTLVVLGGAYLLRAITESHVVAPQAGVALGLIYGAPWLVLASRAEGRGAHLDATGDVRVRVDQEIRLVRGEDEVPGGECLLDGTLEVVAEELVVVQARITRGQGIHRPPGVGVVLREVGAERHVRAHDPGRTR